MKRISLFILLIVLTLPSFSQKGDTIQLFQNKKKERKKVDAVEQIESQPEGKRPTIYYIKYGINSSSCSGYCSKEATIDSVRILKVSKPFQPDAKYPLKKDSTETNTAQWELLVSYVDINSFIKIPKKVGTPDAGGHGSEWIEIKAGTKIHKVVYDETGPEEYEGIKNLGKLLKQIAGY